MNKFYVLILFFFCLISCSEDDEIRFAEVPSDYFVNDLEAPQDYNAEEWQDFTGIPFYVKSVASGKFLSLSDQQNTLILKDFTETDDRFAFGLSNSAYDDDSFTLISVPDVREIGVGENSDILQPVVFSEEENNQFQDTQYWRILPSKNENYSLIQNVNLGENNSNFILESAESSVFLSAKNDAENQQFQIIPRGNFEIYDIEFLIDEGEVTNSEWIMVNSDTIANSSDDVMEFSDTDEGKFPKSFTASFTENNQQISVELENDSFQTRLPEILFDNEEVTIDLGSRHEVSYNEAFEWTTNFGSSEDFTFNIPPQATYAINYSLNKYHFEVPYKVTYRDSSSGARFSKKGIWESDYYYQTNVELSEVEE